MADQFTAIVARKREDEKVTGALEQLTLADLPDLPVLVEVSHSTINYKDALAVTGASPICRSLPMVCGIDLAGSVVESADSAFAPGDKVLVNGFGMSETQWGGYTRYQRVKPEWLVKIPAAFTPADTMAIGTAGYTAMLSVMALQDHGLSPTDGPIAVTGASGGVGSFSIKLLSALGYDAVAVSGRAEENRSYFEGLGAKDVLERGELDRDAKPLERETFAGGIDSVGAKTLGTLLAQTKYDGIIAACGLAGGIKLPTTVMPFILRGVTLRGIDSVMAPQARRQAAWAKMADLLTPADFEGIAKTISLSDVPATCADLLAGKITGRLVVEI